MNILVFCSAQDVSEKYNKVGTEFAALIAKRGYTLVWGGSNCGMMKLIADAAQDAGGKIIGVSTQYFLHKARKNADEMIATPDLGERKRVMLEKADAIVALPGGLGTLDEMAEMLALKRMKQHEKPIVFLDVDGFYDGMKMLLEKMEAEGFMQNIDGDVAEGALSYFATSPEDALYYIEREGKISR